MGGWMDGWMGGWVGGWEGGWLIHISACSVFKFVLPYLIALRGVLNDTGMINTVFSGVCYHG